MNSRRQIEDFFDIQLKNQLRNQSSNQFLYGLYLKTEDLFVDYLWHQLQNQAAHSLYIYLNKDMYE